MTHLLFDVAPTDPLTYLLVGATLAASASIACYLPARAATRVDPVAALRHESRLTRQRPGRSTGGQPPPNGSEFDLTPGGYTGRLE